MPNFKYQKIDWTTEMDTLLKRMWAADGVNGNIAFALNKMQSSFVVSSHQVRQRAAQLRLPKRAKPPTRRFGHAFGIHARRQRL